MNTGQFKYRSKFLENMVPAEPFQWVAVHKKIHLGMYMCISLGAILQIITPIDIHTCGKPIFHHGFYSIIIYIMMGHTINYQHIILILTIKLFDLIDRDNNIKILRWGHQIF